MLTAGNPSKNLQQMASKLESRVERGRHSHPSFPALELSRAPRSTISWSRAPSPPPHPVSAALIGWGAVVRRARTNEKGALLRQAVGRSSSFVQRLSGPGVCVIGGGARLSEQSAIVFKLLLCTKLWKELKWGFICESSAPASRKVEISWMWGKASAHWHSWLSAWLCLRERDKGRVTILSFRVELHHEILTRFSFWGKGQSQSCNTLHSFMFNNNRNGQVVIFQFKSCDRPVARHVTKSCQRSV